MAGQDSKAPVARRQVLAAGIAAAAALTGVALQGGTMIHTQADGAEGEANAQPQGQPLPQPKPQRMPVAYVPHGGGPWPFVDLPLGGKDELAALSAYLRNLPKILPEAPKALLVISAHWEEALPTVMTAPQPPMLYDYYGFPEEAYRVQWPAPGAPQLAARVQELLTAAGIRSAADPKRGFDHGTFVPLKLAWPAAEVPTVQLSLQRGLDPQVHLALGRALAPLRSEGVFIVGSGMSYHNMRGFGDPRAKQASQAFDRWLQEAVALAGPQRDQQLAQWQQAPQARQVHPREEHLLPLMVIAGAAQGDAGRVAYSGELMGVAISAHHFG